MVESNMFAHGKKQQKSDWEREIENMVTEDVASDKTENVDRILSEMKRELLAKLSRAKMTDAIATCSSHLLQCATELRDILEEIDKASSTSEVSMERARRVYLEAYADLAQLKELLVKSSVSGHFNWLRTSGVLEYVKPTVAALPQAEQELLRELSMDEEGAVLIKKIIESNLVSLDADLEDILGKWVNRIYVFVTTGKTGGATLSFRTWVFAGVLIFTGAAFVGLNLGGFDASKGLAVGLVTALSSAVTGGRLAVDAYKLIA